MKSFSRTSVSVLGLAGLILFILLIVIVSMSAAGGADEVTPIAADTPEDLSMSSAPAGTHESADVNLRYTNPGSWRQIISYPEASYVKIHFAQIDLKPGDAIVVSDAFGNQIRTYPGYGFTANEEPGIWALSVLGDTAVVELVQGMEVTSQTGKSYGYFDRAQAGAADSELGVHIDMYARGYPGAVAEMMAPDSTCGINERADVVCWETTHPTEFGIVDAVAKVLQNGASHCTSWRVSSENRMMSNEHCITSQAQLDNMEFWFNYQRPGCGTGDPNANVTVVAGDTFLIDDYTLDFALFTVDNFASIQSFGFLEIDPRPLTLHEEIYIGQHGAGNPKEFGIDSDFDPPDNLCRINDTVRNGRGTGTDTGYYCDTTGGSSGSPVLARNGHKVVAIHHFGTGGAACSATVMNGGVRMELIWPLIEGFFSTIPTLSDSTVNTLPGTTVTHTLDLYNPAASDTFTITLEAGNWPTVMTTSSQLVVGQEMTGTIEIVVDVPHLPETIHGSDTFTVTAQPASDPAMVMSGLGTTNQETHPGLEVSEAMSKTGDVGTVLTFTLTVTNTGDYTDTFDLNINGNAWPTSASASQVGPLGPGNSGTVEIYVTVVAGAPTDVVTITFTSNLDNGVATQVMLTSKASTLYLYLPVALILD